MTPILYVKTGCPWCIAAEEYLQEKGYEYERFDVRQDAEKFSEMEALSGQTLSPTMSVGDLVLADFGVPELERFLEENEISPDE